MTSPRRNVIGALVAGALVLAGCSESGEEAEPSPTISYPPLPSPSQSVSPSASLAGEGLVPQPEDPYPYPLPVPGEFIDENSQRGAEQFAFYYIEQLGYFNNTNDVSVMEPLTHKDCATCWAAYEDLEEQYARGAWGANLQYVPLRVWEYTTDKETGDIAVVVLSHASEWLSYSAEDTKPQIMPERRAFFQVNVVWDGRWLASDIYANVEETG